MNPRLSLVLVVLLTQPTKMVAESIDRQQVLSQMKQAARFFREQVALRGGYVYYYSPDLRKRLAEGPATPTQICVQPPATPTVGMAYLAAYQATGDRYYLDAAREAAEALVYGQLKSGGWTQTIDFNPRSRAAAQYRNGRGNSRGKNNSSLDDGQTQSAMRFLINCDSALGFKHASIHESSLFALRALLNAQFPNGAFPQVWTGPVSRQKVVRASYPGYDWRTEGRIKNYWDMYTLNDGVAGYLAPVLIDAHRVYEDDAYMQALRKLGDFLILAQMPDPQPAWAQQYNYEMHPIWARRFEPPAIAARESEDVMFTLMNIYRHTGERRFLTPIPKALDYLKRSLLPDGRSARYYELRNNRPLYMNRKSGTKNYFLTNSDANLPNHYGWKNSPRIDEIEREYQDQAKNRSANPPDPETNALLAQARKALKQLDRQGRWITRYSGQLLVGQPRFRAQEAFISSAVFGQNLNALSRWLSANN